MDWGCGRVTTRIASVSESPLEWVVGRAAESTSPPVPSAFARKRAQHCRFSGTSRAAALAATLEGTVGSHCCEDGSSPPATVKESFRVPLST